MRKILIFIFCFFCVYSLESQMTSVWEGTVVPPVAGTGTAANPYLIESAAHLAYLATEEAQQGGWLSKCFKMTVDVDLQNRLWMPIALTEPYFTGIFDGNGHVVKNLNVNYITQGNAVDWRANLAHSRYDWFESGIWTDGSLGGAGVQNYEYANHNLHIWSEGNTWQRPKRCTARKIYGPGLYSWRVYVPDMEANAQTCIAAFLWADDRHELDFEIGSGTAAARQQYNAQNDEVLVYITSQDNPWYQHVFPIKVECWYDLEINLTLTAGNKYQARWLINGKEVGRTSLTFGPEIQFGVYCSVENLGFIGDRLPTRNHDALFNKVGFRALDASNPTIPYIAGDFVGLFANVSGTNALVKNLGIESGNVTGQTKTGAVVGFLRGGATITNCYNKANVYGWRETGGIAGAVAGSVINCYNRGSIFGNVNTGGVIGRMMGDRCTVQNNYNAGRLIGYAGANYGSFIGTCPYELHNQTIMQNNYYDFDLNNPQRGIGTEDSSIGEDTHVTLISQHTVSVTSKSTTLIQADNMIMLLGNAYKKDIWNQNNGYPVLEWETASGGSGMTNYGSSSDMIQVLPKQIRILADGVNVVIYDMMGRKISPMHVSQGTDICLATGMYVLLLEYQKVLYREKISIRE